MLVGSSSGYAMNRLALCLLLLATGTSAQENVIDVQHYSRRGVTCWILNGVGISCVPDTHLIQRPQASGESPHEQESEPTPATAPGRWDEERYSL